MKFCKHCGKEVLDDAIICPNCGCSVEYDMPNKSNVQGDYCSVDSIYTNQQQQTQRIDSYSGLSIAGFVLSFFGGLLGLILSIVANNEAKSTGSRKSQTLSKAGIIISAVYIGIEVLVVIISMVILGIAAGSAMALPAILF